MIVSLYSESLGYCLHLIYLINCSINNVHTHTHTHARSCSSCSAEKLPYSYTLGCSFLLIGAQHHKPFHQRSTICIYTKSLTLSKPKLNEVEGSYRKNQSHSRIRRSHCFHVRHVFII